MHLLRHGEVHNPEGVLYGRLDGYHLSDLGREMAARVADHLADRDITHVVRPPARARPGDGGAAGRGARPPIATDDRVIESGNVFEGKRFGRGDSARCAKPQHWIQLCNPFKPSWGEPYKEVVARMLAAVDDARDAARGHEAVDRVPPAADLDHPARARGRAFVHDPRKRQCTPRLADHPHVRRRRRSSRSPTPSPPPRCSPSPHGGTG